jgi:RNA polymerase subunit RPABC4/transcription elongation factor Spt4
LEEVLARVLQLFVALTGAYALALWFALIVWTYRDITARTTNAVTQVFATLVVVLFFVPGAIIYLILRPRETLDDAFQRTMEEEYLLQDLDDFPVCPACRRSVRDEFMFCPHCKTELRLPCIACHRLVDVRWENCPYCGVTQYEDALSRSSEDEMGELPLRATRHGRAGSFQTIDGGRSRDSAPATEGAPEELRWDHDETVPSLHGPGFDASRSDGSDDDDDELRGDSDRREPTARVARDRG